MQKPHAYFFGFISHSLAKVSASDCFVVDGHIVYLESGLVGGRGKKTLTVPENAPIRPAAPLVEGTMVTCAIDEEGGVLRLVSAMSRED